MLSVFLVDISESFWKRRLELNLDLLLELDLLEKADLESLDWQVLWMGLMDLLSHPLWPASGLATRQRILPFMKEIIVSFHELEKDSGDSFCHYFVLDIVMAFKIVLVTCLTTNFGSTMLLQHLTFILCFLDPSLIIIF